MHQDITQEQQAQVPSAINHSAPTLPDIQKDTIIAEHAPIASPATTNKQTFTWPPPPRPRRQPSRVRYLFHLTIIVLAILLIISGLSLALYSTSVQYRSALDTSATAAAQSTRDVVNTAQARQQGTANALSTAQANINATATAQVGNSVTATALVENATATALAQDNQYTHATAGNPAFNDPMNNRSGPGKWDVGTTSAQSGCAFTNNQYTVGEAQLGYFQPCIARGTSFTNFVYQVSVTITQGDAAQAGILFRIDNDNQAYYFFRIGLDSSYALDLYQNNNQAHTLLQGTNNAILSGLNQINELTVMAQGSTLTFFVNTQYITTTTETTLNAGKIGVAVIDGNTPVSATFSNAQVWTTQKHD
jgi:hypothetical protein